MWLFDVSCVQWRELGSYANQLPRLWHTGTQSTEGEVIVFGGCHGDILSHEEPAVSRVLDFVYIESSFFDH